MSTSTTGSRALAIAAGTLFTGGALFILLEDVLLHAAPWGLKHALTAIVVAGTIMVGHLASEAKAVRHWLAASGFAVLFLAGTALTVYQSVGRQAEGPMVALAAAEAQAEALARARKGLSEAEAMLAEAQRRLAAECGTGKGPKCQGVRTTVEVYEAAAKGHRADLEKLGPVRVAAPEARRAGELAAVFGLDARKVEAGAILVVPFLTTLFLELGAIVSLGYGFRRAATSAASGRLPDASRLAAGSAQAESEGANKSGPSGGQPAQPDRLVRPGPSGRLPGGQSDGPTRKAEVLAAITTDVALGRTVESQRAMAGRFGVPTSTLSDWLREWEAAGLIPTRRTVGRCKVLEGA